jgi:hypothetical protein
MVGSWLQIPSLFSVLRISIRRIRMFLGLLDPDPDQLVRCMDPDPDSIRILLSPSKNSKKILIPSAL